MNADIPQFSTPPSEAAEPRACASGFPVWMIVLLAITTYAGVLCFDDRDGDFSAQVFAPYASTRQLEDFLPKDPERLAFLEGRKLYTQNCAACHQASGLGLAGQFPPLAGSDWVKTEGPNRIIRLVLHGIQGPIQVNGLDFNNAMVPWKDNMTDQQVASVITYVRRNKDWGHAFSAVTPEQVKKIRDAEKSRTAPWSAGELLKLSDK